VLWALLLVAGLLVFNTVDADGDPLTANGPPVVLAAEAVGPVESEAEMAGTDAADVVRARTGRGLRRFVAAGARRVPTLWHPLARPIRGP